MNIKEIAAKAGVSIATVSRALNQPELVKEKTREKILKIVEEIKYTPNIFAQGLSTGKTNNIVIVVPTLNNPKFGFFAEGAEDFLFEKDYSLTIFNTNESFDRQDNILEYVIKKRVNGYVDGIIFAGSAPFVDGPEKLVNNIHIPIVAIENILEQNLFSCIEVDDLEGIQLIFSHFKKSGYNDIGIIHGQRKIPVTVRRFNKIQAIIEEFGLSVNPKNIAEGSYDSFESGYEAMQQIINNGEHPKAIYAFNDLLAIGAMRCIHDNKLRIPEDIAIVGSDDTIGKFLNPSLTSLHYPQKKIGYRAAQMLVEHIENPQKEIEKILITPELIIRESC